MRHTRVLLAFILFFIFLLMVVWGDAETAKELEKRLLEASSPPEQLEYLSRLVKIYSQEAPQKAREYGKQALEILEDGRQRSERREVEERGVCIEIQPLAVRHADTGPAAQAGREDVVFSAGLRKPALDVHGDGCG